VWFGSVAVCCGSRCRSPSNPIARRLILTNFSELELESESEPESELESEWNDEGGECINGGSGVDAGPLAPGAWQRKHTLRIGVVVHLCRNLVFARPIRRHYVRSYPRSHVSWSRRPRDSRAEWFSCWESSSWYFLLPISFPSRSSHSTIR